MEVYFSNDAVVNTKMCFGKTGFRGTSGLPNAKSHTVFGLKPRLLNGVYRAFLFANVALYAVNQGVYFSF